MKQFNLLSTSRLSFLIIISVLFHNCGGPSMKKANESFDQKQYTVAADMFKKLTSSSDLDKKEKQEAAFKAAEGYRLSHEPSSAEKMYEKAINYGVKDPIVLFRLAEAKKELGKFQEAIEYFQKYQKEAPSDPRTKVMIDGCEKALEWKETKSRYTVSNFKPANDSKSDDFAPMFADKKQTVMLFTSDRPDGRSKEQYKWTGRNHTDVWAMKKEGRGKNAKWSKPEIVEGLNTKFNDGVLTFNSRFNVMYITQCNGEDGKEPNCKIYEARRVGKGFEMSPEPLSFCKDSFNYGHPTLSQDEKTMYFVSDRPGGMGNEGDLENTKDIWMVTYVKRGRTWSDPINLGPIINTSGNEMFPYLHPDGTLYFSSDGHPGMGGLDIFESKNLGEPTQWETPVNMRFPINSSSDDFGIIMDQTKTNGFFSSNRVKDKDDIYEFFMEPILCTLKGQVTDCDSGTAIANSLVVISNNIDSSKIRILTNEKGYYETPININTKYEINVSKRGSYYYDAKPQYLSTMGVENSLDCQHVKDFCMKNTCNDVFVLPIFYDLDKAFIRADAKPVLDDLVNTLKKYPTMKVELGSHTDCRAKFEYNRALSQRRADSAVAYILSRGINPFRLEARGYGESQLVNDCACEDNITSNCSEQEHQQNRRTTVKVVNCNFDVLSIGINYKMRNDAALEGQGSIYSPYLLEQQRAYIVKTKGDIDSFMKAQAIQESLAKAEKEQKELEAKYDIIPLTKSGDSYTVFGSVGKKKVRFFFNGEDRRTEIPEDFVVQLMAAGALSVKDFADAGEKIKLLNGEKVYSKNFTLKKLEIGNITFTNVKCKMTPERSKAKFGYQAINKAYEEFEIKEDKLWLLKFPVGEVEEEDAEEEDSSNDATEDKE